MCEHREEQVRERKLLPQPGKSLPFPRGGHRSPGWPQTQHGHDQGQLSQSSINTLVHLPRANPAPDTAPLMFFPPNCFGSAALCVSRGGMTHRWVVLG